MKRLSIMCIALGAVLSGCASGDYAFFRSPSEQLAINQAYTQHVVAMHGGETAVGGTSGMSGSGATGIDHPNR